MVHFRTSLLTQLSQHWDEEVPRGLDETGPQKSLLSLYEERGTGQWPQSTAVKAQWVL